MRRLTFFYLVSLFLFWPIFFVSAAPGNYTLLEPTLIGKSGDTTINSLQSYGGAAGFAAYFQMIYGMLMAIGVLTCIFFFVWDGFKLMVSEVPLIKIKAKDNIWRALEGLAFILGAYLILNTINPRLTKIDLNLIKINIAAGDASSGLTGGGPTNYGDESGNGGSSFRQYGAPQGGSTDPNRFQAGSPGQGKYGYVPANEFQVRSDLKAAGVNINDDSSCTQANTGNCKTYVGGVNSKQLEGVKKMKQECDCEVTISGGAEQGGHSNGSRHYTGNAVDIRMSSQVTSYVNANPDKFWWTNNEGDHWHLEFK